MITKGNKCKKMAVYKQNVLVFRLYTAIFK